MGSHNYYKALLAEILKKGTNPYRTREIARIVYGTDDFSRSQGAMASTVTHALRKANLAEEVFGSTKICKIQRNHQHLVEGTLERAYDLIRPVLGSRTSGTGQRQRRRPQEALVAATVPPIGNNGSAAAVASASWRLWLAVADLRKLGVPPEAIKGWVQQAQ